MKRRADGRLCKTITDERTGQRLYFYGKTEREITKKILAYSEQSKQGRTFSEVALEWWEEAQIRLARQTVKVYRPAMLRAIEAFGSKYIKEIKPGEISVFLLRLAKQDFAQKTIANQKGVINMIFDHAVLANDRQDNPCGFVPMPKTAPKAHRSPASPEDEATVKNTYSVWIFPYIAIMTGMRKGEILALQWRDIDFEENTIYVTKSVEHDGDRPLIKQPKTEAGIREVPLLAPLRAVLLAMRGRPSHYIVSDDGESPLTNRRYQTLWTQYQRLTGIKCTAHQLRHSFATIAFECGVPIKSVQEILGHKQLSTTMDIYTDFRKKAAKDAARLMEENMA